jgi:hypothetical protein
MAMKYDGLVLLDDIHCNQERKRWWKGLEETSNNLCDRHDLTSVGHFFQARASSISRTVSRLWMGWSRKK